MAEAKKDNREHSFDFELAEIVGLEKAILLKNVSYWCEENARKRAKPYFKNGHYWTSESLRSLAEKYRYFKRPSISRWIKEMEAADLLIVNRATAEVNYYRTGPVYDRWRNGEDVTELFQKKEVSQNGPPPEVSQNEMPVSQNETGGVSKWAAGCLKMRHTNVEIDIEGNNIEGNIEKSFPNAKKASGDTPPKTPWTKEVSSLFDKINEEAHRAANLEYGPFNWAAGGGRQFAALKKIRDAMIPDIERKLHHTPDEKEIQSGFEYLFRYGFEFFKKVADDKGGAINFTPSAILNSYNLILSHARASHTTRKSKQEQRIDDQHEARAAFYRELVSDLVETGDGGG
jgi:hypothetical protein